LEADGHTVTRLVRNGKTSPTRVLWNPRAADASGIPAGTFDGVDAVIHLAGAGVGDKRWTQAYKREILESRTLSTQTVTAAIAAGEHKPSVLVSASAIGFYGDTGDRAVDETAQPGTGFLADVVTQWESAAHRARAAGVRVVHPRTGLVMSKWGGAWQRMLPLFKAGLGGKLGSGQQWWSWISLRDEVRALRFLIDSPLSGPVNLTAPNPETNAAVTAAMGRALKRPTILPAPAFALKAALGEFSVEVLGSARVLPTKLEQAGFTWLDPTFEQALAALLAE
jgi:hypothetical protein